MKKPPLGLMPKKYYEEQRFYEVCSVIARYYEAGLEIRIEWVEEYNEFIKKKKDKNGI